MNDGHVGSTIAGACRNASTVRITSFRKNLDRARAFIRLHAAREMGAPSADERELPRGAVVLAIGALDAFLHDLTLEIVPRFGVASPELAASLRTLRNKIHRWPCVSR